MATEIKSSMPTWNRNVKPRDDTYDQNGYHGDRDTTLVPLGSRPIKQPSQDYAADVFTTIMMTDLKANFLGNVARWTQVDPSTKSGSNTVFQLNQRHPGWGSMLALAPTITYNQRTVTYSINQWRLSLPFDQFILEYNDAQPRLLLAMGMRQIYSIFENHMNNSVLSALRIAYMHQFKTPIAWLEETLQYAGLLNEKGFTGAELLSLFKNIQPDENARLLLATSETAFTSLNLPPVNAASPGITSTPIDPSNLLSLLTSVLKGTGQRRQIGNLDIYGIAHYTNAHNANVLQTSESIDNTYFVHGVIFKKSVPEGTSFILIPSTTGLWYKMIIGAAENSKEIMFTKHPVSIFGSDMMTGPLLAGKPLFEGKFWPARSIQAFDQETGSANILTMTGWGGSVLLRDQVAIGGAAMILSTTCSSKNVYAEATLDADFPMMDYDENRSKLVDLANLVQTHPHVNFDNQRMRAGEWQSSFELNAVKTSQNYGAGALMPFIAVSATGQRTWVAGHPMFERLAVAPHAGRINNNLTKVIPTHNDFLPSINTITHVASIMPAK